MSCLNKVELIGYLGSDPVLRTTPNENLVVNIFMATTEHFKNAKGEDLSVTEWHSLTFWNQKAEIISEFTKKGSYIYVQGRLQTQYWTDKKGVERYSKIVVVDRLILLDKKQWVEDEGLQATKTLPEEILSAGKDRIGPDRLNDSLHQDMPF